MEMASFFGLIRTLFFILLALYFLKILTALFAPVLIKKAAQKVQQNMEEQMRRQQQAYQNTQYSQQNEQKEMPKEKNKVGEYVDFEEIE